MQDHIFLGNRCKAYEARNSITKNVSIFDGNKFDRRKILPACDEIYRVVESSKKNKLTEIIILQIILDNFRASYRSLE